MPGGLVESFVDNVTGRRDALRAGSLKARRVASVA
jgi:hypothetical protein